MQNKHVTIIVLSAFLFSACSGGNDGPEGNTLPSVDTVLQNTPALKEGPQVIHMDDGGRMVGEMKAGQRTGPWTSYFPEGNVRSTSTYVAGSEEGATQVFHPNGKPYYTGSYMHGKPVGDWVFFDPSGKELKRVLYDSLGTVVGP
jgi:antitoxin component YwqK of YwqJK toxin-antitoxin module